MLSARTKLYLYGILGILYLAASLAAYFFNIFTLQFCLAIPWSMPISMVGFLLIHMQSGLLEFAFVAGSILNLLLWGRFMIYKAGNLQTDDL